MRSRPPRIPEKTVQAQIVAALRVVGAKVYVIGHASPADGRAFRGTGQTPGIPDLMAFLPARVVRDSDGGILDGPMDRLLFIEVKAHGGRLRPEQADFRDRCLGADVEHVVGGLDEVYAWLLGYGYIKDSQVSHYRLPKAVQA